MKRKHRSPDSEGNSVRAPDDQLSHFLHALDEHSVNSDHNVLIAGDFYAALSKEGK